MTDPTTPPAMLLRQEVESLVRTFCPNGYHGAAADMIVDLVRQRERAAVEKAFEELRRYFQDHDFPKRGELHRAMILIAGSLANS